MNHLGRRLFAEALGTALLVAAVIGSGTAAANLSPSDTGLQLLENAVATAAGLAVIILLVGPVSGAHVNPVVSLADWWLGRRRGIGLPLTEVGAYAAAQVAGGILGAILANLMFDLSAVRWSTHDRSGAHLQLGEVVATAGLVALAFALARRDRGLHRLGVLLHLLHLVRESGRHRGADVQRHVRRHRPGVGPAVRPGPAPRRSHRCGHRARPLSRRGRVGGRRRRAA